MRRWEDTVRMNPKEMGVNMRNSVYSTQDMNYWRAVVNAALIIRVLQSIE